MKQGTDTKGSAPDTRERILQTASALFYREGTRAVGVDLIVAQAGVAKTSLYRHFATKDDLIEAFLLREDADFWAHWDAVAARYRRTPREELDAQLQWIGERIERPGYRGCPQINIAAEYADANHPARKVAVRAQAGIAAPADGTGKRDRDRRTADLRAAARDRHRRRAQQRTCAARARPRALPAGIRATADADEGHEVKRG